MICWESLEAIWSTTYIDRDIYIYFDRFEKKKNSTELALFLFIYKNFKGQRCELPISSYILYIALFIFLPHPYMSADDRG